MRMGVPPTLFVQVFITHELHPTLSFLPIAIGHAHGTPKGHKLERRPGIRGRELHGLVTANFVSRYRSALSNR
jgi:hypothetical protein